MSVEVKQELKEEAPDSHVPPGPVASIPSSSPFSNPSASVPFQRSVPLFDDTKAEIREPGALYTCGNCTHEVYITASSPIQCPQCEHLTGSSTVFYKIRRQATTYDTI